MFLEFNFLDQFPFETPRSQKPLSITCLKSVTPKLEKRKISGSLGVGGGGFMEKLEFHVIFWITAVNRSFIVSILQYLYSENYLYSERTPG